MGKRQRGAPVGDRRAAGRLAGLGFLAGLATLAGPVGADEIAGAPAIPPLRELEAAGAVVGEIRIDNQNIFDLDDPKENGPLFRLANWLHIRTRPEVIERGLLFKSGDPLSVRRLEETERLLGNNRFLYDVDIKPTAYRDGVVDLEVETRDTWTLDPGISFSRQGGSNSSGIALKEKNLLGTGLSVAYSRRSNVDRTGNTFELSQNHAFDGWTELFYAEASNSDGRRREAAIRRPFYALDTRWAAGASSLDDQRIDPVYTGGKLVAQYRRREKRDEVFAGWSTGLRDGWVSRYTAGLRLQEDRFAAVPGDQAPPTLPADEKLAVPYLAYEVIEDDVVKLRNRNQVARAEYFALGFTGRLQLGRARSRLSTQHNAWLYEAEAKRGFSWGGEQMLLLSATLRGRYGAAGTSHQHASAAASYYRPQGEHALFYAAASFDTLKNPPASERLELGGDSGLRGYPLRYQTGEKRLLLTLEERGYTDYYLLRLFRVGGAVFLDLGRAWDGELAGGPAPRWLANAGFGLRLFNTRSAFGNALHADVAFPIDPEPGVEKVQFVLRSKVSF